MSDVTESSKDTNPLSTEVVKEQVLETKSEAPKQTQHPKTNPAKKSPKTGALWFFTLINLLILMAICAGAYWYYLQLQQDTSNENSAISVLTQDIKDITKQQQALLNETESKLGLVNSNQAALSDSINTLAQQNKALALNTESVNKRLAEMSGRRPSDWLLAEANYLVNMAGRKVYLEKDLSTAMTLLQEADQRLQDLNDPSLFPVRALIAADIQALNQATPVSTTSIALAIAGMLPKVSELPMDSLKLPETESATDLTLSENVSDWQSNLAKTWEAIVGDFFSIKAIDQPLEPYLAERQQWLIEQQIKHALAQAQTAVLNEQGTLFKSAIQQAIAGLVEHYKIDNANVGQFIEALQQLQNSDFSQNIPNKLSSQASLKDIIEQRIQNLYNNSAPAQEDTSAQGSSL